MIEKEIGELDISEIIQYLEGQGTDFGFHSESDGRLMVLVKL